ncbi:hypothetical protein GWI33_018783 [Rhynchophorus ferrugineus]|uniref:Uncharacterized protein n=1 Tax=Rhynchophorus ferrugineus TaxID=354439 RepID=A0A834HT05_RHYFE|nr:hypothetical protein GWI33_018783 [Rhynchophorus ferrugineus]
MSTRQEPAVFDFSVVEIFPDFLIDQGLKSENATADKRPYAVIQLGGPLRGIGELPPVRANRSWLVTDRNGMSGEKNAAALIRRAVRAKTLENNENDRHRKKRLSRWGIVRTVDGHSLAERPEHLLPITPPRLIMFYVQC